MGQEKTFSSALSNLAKMKTDAEKANEKVQAATDKAVAFAQSLKQGTNQGTNQAASSPAAPAKPVRTMTGQKPVFRLQDPLPFPLQPLRLQERLLLQEHPSEHPS